MGYMATSTAPWEQRSCLGCGEEAGARNEKLLMTTRTLGYVAGDN